MSRLASTVFALAFLSALAGGAVALAPKMRCASVRRLAEVFPAKPLFIDLNGGVRRLAGCRICNNRIVLRNGNLGHLKFRIPDAGWALRKELAFAEFLASNNVPFLHVQAPTGVDIPKTLLREVCECNGNAVAGRYCAQLQDGGVPVLDLRETFAGTAADVGRYFLRTDHHWNYEAAFLASEMLAAKVVEMLDLPVPNRDDPLSRKEWRVERLPSWRTGSHSARTGFLFDGVDDLDYRVPSVKTRVRCVMYDKNGVAHKKKGRFRDVFVSKKVVAKRDWHARASFRVFPSVNYVCFFANESAPSRTRVVILGDSFARPVPAYLTKLFSEVVLIDPRYLSSCRKFRSAKVAEFVLSLRPDIVVQLMYPGSFNPDFGDAGLGRHADKMFDYGLE